MFRTASLAEVDYLTLLLALALAGLGAASIAGATWDESAPMWTAQVQWIVFALPFCIAVIFLDYRILIRWAPLIYILAIVGVLLCFVPGIGHRSHGAYSWIKLGPLPQIQTSEIAKLATVIMLAKWLGSRPGQWNGLLDALQPLAMGALPAVLVLMQPDLGTAIVFGPLTLAMMFVAGMPLTQMFLLLSPAACLLGAFHGVEFILIWVSLMAGLILASVINRAPWSLWLPCAAVAAAAYAGIFVYGETMWNKMPSHQQERIITYLNPDTNIRGAGHNIFQSKIALGSGGFQGKGLGNSTQAQLEFLPEYEHDFAFSVFGEQMGFLGGAILLGLFLMLIIRGVDTAIEAKTLEGALISTGIVSIFFTHIFINVGMVTGLLPVTGLPLTFISYGGTFMLTTMIGVGLLLNVRLQARRVQEPETRNSGRPPMALPTRVEDDF